MTSAGFRSSTADNRVRRQGTAALLAAAASAGVRRYVVQSIPFSLHPKASRSTPFASTTLRSSPVSTRTDSPNGAGASTHGRVVGCGDRLTSVVHVHDAAAATVLAVTSGAPGIYKVVDDEPAPLRDRLPAYADALGAKPPHRVPRRAARLMRGEFIADIRQGASNAKAKAELGWRPALTSWREGFRSALDSDPAAPPRDPDLRPPGAA